MGKSTMRVRGWWNCTSLMKHQIAGLEFLLDHECLDENIKAKGKGKYGGLLADDVRTLPTLSVLFWRSN